MTVTPGVVTVLDTTVGKPAVPSRALPRELVKLGPLMASCRGRPEVSVGLIDGPVTVDHPDLASEMIRSLTGRDAGCTVRGGGACFHGTFVAGILSARRTSAAPALCPGCTLLVRPIFTEAPAVERLPAASPQDLVDAMLECIDAGAQVLNLSATLARASARDERALQAVLDYACRRGVAVVAAAGNESAIGGSVITRHPWVVSVVGYSLRGRPLARSNFGAVIGRQGLGAPGENVTSLRATGGTATAGGTSVAAPFVTGTFALLLSAFPGVGVAEVWAAVVGSVVVRRRSVVPPLLDAGAAYRALRMAREGRSGS
jgi:subtilisin family serine protease